MGADNGIPLPEAPPGMPSTGAQTALDFLTAAAAAARAHPPEPVPSTLANDPRPEVRDGFPPDDALAADAAAAAAAAAGIPAGLDELDERATDSACTPAGVAQALARVACRLYELADTLGGARPSKNRRDLLDTFVSFWFDFCREGAGDAILFFF